MPTGALALCIARSSADMLIKACSFQIWGNFQQPSSFQLMIHEIRITCISCFSYFSRWKWPMFTPLLTHISVLNNYSIFRKKHIFIRLFCCLTLSRRSFAVWISSSPSWMTNLPSDHSVAIWKRDDIIDMECMAVKKIKIVTFKHTDSVHEHFSRNCSLNTFYDKSTLAQVTGNKPLTEPIFTQIYFTIWHH